MATYFKQKKGWSFLIWVTDSEGNKKQRRYSGYATKKEAELAANEISCKVSNIPHLGRIKLSELRPLHVQNMIRAMHNSGLKTKTITYARGVLRKALNDALRLEIIEKNPTLFVDIPKGKKFQPQFYNNKEIVELIRKAEGKRIQMPIILGAGLGLRRGEILGLQWGDIDFENKTVMVQRSISTMKDSVAEITEPKSETSRRMICCPDFIIQKLKDEYSSRVDIRTGRRRMVLDNEFVCITDSGYPYTPHTLSTHFRKFLRDNKFKHIRFHDLRHSCASLLIKSGVDMKTTSMILGHSSIGITMDLYSHIDIEQKINVAERVNSMLGM